MGSKVTYPLAVEVKLMMVEGAKFKLLREDYARIRREIRKGHLITQDEVKALIEAGDRARVKAGASMVVPYRTTAKKARSKRSPLLAKLMTW